jgi:N-acyl homoserine lactone hydrolase
MTMKMHILNGGHLRMRRSVYLPTEDRSQTIDLPVSCVLLRHPQGNVLFDTGCHPDTMVDAAPRWGSMARALIPIGRPEDNVIDSLAALGLVPDDIDVVVNSHFHPDHCGCNCFFRRATVFCHIRELEAARAAGAVEQGYLPTEWDHPMLMRTIDVANDIFGDGRITLLPLPGHTPGTIGALITLDRDGAFLLTADAMPLRENLERELLPRNTLDVDAAGRSMQEILRLQRSGAKIIFGHDANQWLELRKGADAYV